MEYQIIKVLIVRGNNTISDVVWEITLSSFIDIFVFTSVWMDINSYVHKKMSTKRGTELVHIRF